MSGELKATLHAQPLKGDDVLSALEVLGPAIDELERVTDDAGFRSVRSSREAKRPIRSNR